ncbi:MAG: hypothetical protein D6689_06170 [Deltaproteobacteria bacterium]|nr:MAG: hypothetical protein D6689_06170 [Deltaproteobacteria bacterium]
MTAASKWAALALAVAAAACGARAPSADDPGAVADRFIDRYVVEADQRAALELADGVARTRLEDEMEQVRAVRGAGAPPSGARPRVYWERVSLRTDGSRSRAVYDVRLSFSGDETRRHVLVSLTRRDRGWRVTSFVVRDGPAARR